MSCLDILRLPLDWVDVLSHWIMGQNWRRCRCFHWLILGRKRHWVKTRHPKQSHCLKLTQQWLIASLAHNLKSGHYVCNGMLSSTGRVAVSLTAAYSVTKYGVEGFSDVLRREMHRWGIKVSMVEPGAHQTPMTDPRTFERQFWQAWNESSAELQKDYGPEYLEKGILVFIYLLFTLSIAGLAVSTRKFDREMVTLERKAVSRCLKCKTTATKRSSVDKCNVTLPR